MQDKPLIRELFDGPLDVVGDVHGEWEPLQALRRHLGYDEDGVHPDGRHLIFVGDLGDRGPDSPAVISWVHKLVDLGRAQCVMGNHELNLIRQDPKAGNAWFLNPNHEEQTGTFKHSKPATVEGKARWEGFLDTLPLALEREDLRVVHAQWHEESVEKLRGERGSVRAVFEEFETQLNHKLQAGGLKTRADEEKARHSKELGNDGPSFPFLEALAEYEALQQTGNPVRALSSGVEREVPSKEPFFASHRWRFCNRVAWWEEYDAPESVIMGHYWRKIVAPTGPAAEGKPYVFEGYGPTEWLGPSKRVSCNDFSIGMRYNKKAGPTRLAAVRWPERKVVFHEEM